MFPALFNVTVTVKRRKVTGRDSLNNPIYGTPTSGGGWSTLYLNMPARLDFSQKDVQFAPTGERVTPSGVGYFPDGFTVQVEDRFLTVGGVEYVVTSVVPAYKWGAVIDHYEAKLALP